MPEGEIAISDSYDCVVIGGGFYGCSVAEYLATAGKEVLLVEKGERLMARASFTNQARVHKGYHYPRSILTSLRSSLNFERFVDEFSDCIVKDFRKYYAVGLLNSKVTASQFREFCQRIGAPINKAPAEVRQHFETQLIDDVFEVCEYAFDARRLRDRTESQLRSAGVKFLVNSVAGRIRKVPSGVQLEVCRGEERTSVRSKMTFNCTYSRINMTNAREGDLIIPLKHELTEMALVEPPASLADLAITIMDGPYFSFMPFPPRGLHTLSHVRYTPHYHWQDQPLAELLDADSIMKAEGPVSRFRYMIKDAQRYVPAIADCRHVESLWEVKTILPKSEMDDSRPILFKRSAQIPSLYSVMGGKIDNIYDVREHLDQLLKAG